MARLWFAGGTPTQAAFPQHCQSWRGNLPTEVAPLKSKLAVGYVGLRGIHIDTYYDVTTDATEPLAGITRAHGGPYQGCSPRRFVTKLWAQKPGINAAMAGLPSLTPEQFTYKMAHNSIFHRVDTWSKNISPFEGITPTTRTACVSL